jgi:hypothetical protein
MGIYRPPLMKIAGPTATEPNRRVNSARRKRMDDGDGDKIADARMREWGE